MVFVAVLSAVTVAGLMSCLLLLLCMEEEDLGCILSWSLLPFLFIPWNICIVVCRKLYYSSFDFRRRVCYRGPFSLVCVERYFSFCVFMSCVPSENNHCVVVLSRVYHHLSTVLCRCIVYLLYLCFAARLAEFVL